MITLALLITLSSNVEICAPYSTDRSLAVQKNSIKHELLASNHQISDVIGTESMRDDILTEEIDNFQTTLVMSKPKISYKLDEQNASLCGYWDK